MNSLRNWISYPKNTVWSKKNNDQSVLTEIWSGLRERLLYFSTIRNQRMYLAEARYESLFLLTGFKGNKMPCFNGCETYGVSKKVIQIGKKLVLGLYVSLIIHKT